MKTQLTRPLGAALLLLVGMPLLAACGSAATPSATTGAGGGAPYNAAGPAAPPAAAPDQSSQKSNGGGAALSLGAAHSALPPQIIRTATLMLEVKDLQQTLNQVQMIVAQEGGYIASASLGNVPPPPIPYGVSGAPSSGAPVAMPAPIVAGPGQIVVRIPAARLDALVLEMHGLGKLQGQQISSLDVTQQVSDLKGLIAAKTEEQDRLLSFLSKAQTVQDIVTLDQALSDVRSTLLQLEQEQIALADQVQYATVTLVLNAPAPPPQSPWWSPVDWQPSRVVVQTVNSILSVAAGLGQILIAGALWLLALTPLFLLVWLFRHRLPLFRSPLRRLRPGPPPA